MFGVFMLVLVVVVFNVGGFGLIVIIGSVVEKGWVLICEVCGLIDKLFNVNLFCYCLG